jgi:hypothetical protein
MGVIEVITPDSGEIPGNLGKLPMEGFPDGGGR